jgi:type I restriction enzyme S subunit
MPGDREIGVAKVSAVTWGEYNENESKTCTDPEKVNPRYFIKEGDFLFSRANTIELVGACVVAKKVSRTVMLSDKTLRLVFRDLPAHYFLYYLRSHLGRREIMRRSTGNQESMRNIGQDRLRSIVIPMCSSEEANYIQGRIHYIFSSIDYVEASVQTEREKSTALRQVILREAFSGRLVKQDAKDEPATALLERIRSERSGETRKKERSTKNGRRKAA